MMDFAECRKRFLFALVFPALLALCSCGHEDHVNIFHATFTANGTPKDFTTNVGFFQLGSSYDISYSQGNVTNPTANYIAIYLPTSVSVHTYHETDANVLLLYYNAAGTQYRSDDSSNGAILTIDVTAWPGASGYAHGTFTATVGDGFGNMITIASGIFEGFIHN